MPAIPNNHTKRRLTCCSSIGGQSPGRREQAHAKTCKSRILISDQFCRLKWETEQLSSTNQKNVVHLHQAGKYWFCRGLTCCGSILGPSPARQMLQCAGTCKGTGLKWC